jgi:hypothetical protein
MEHGGSRHAFPLPRLQLAGEMARYPKRNGKGSAEPYLVVKFHPAPPSI